MSKSHANLQAVGLTLYIIRSIRSARIRKRKLPTADTNSIM